MANKLREAITIRKVDNLNIDNFFSVAKEICPKVTGSFLEWINRYKVMLQWQNLFADGVKFHQIPLVLQYGVIMQFFKEEYCSNYISENKDVVDPESWIEIICDLFIDEENWNG